MRAEITADPLESKVRADEVVAGLVDLVFGDRARRLLCQETDFVVLELGERQRQKDHHQEQPDSATDRTAVIRLFAIAFKED